MDLRPYYDTLRRTSLLRGMRDDELDNMIRSLDRIKHREFEAYGRLKKG